MEAVVAYVEVPRRHTPRRTEMAYIFSHVGETEEMWGGIEEKKTAGNK